MKKNQALWHNVASLAMPQIMNIVELVLLFVDLIWRNPEALEKTTKMSPVLIQINQATSHISHTNGPAMLQCIQDIFKLIFNELALLQ